MENFHMREAVVEQGVPDVVEHFPAVDVVCQAFAVLHCAQAVGTLINII